MSETTFVYALKEPDTGKIRYVGKAYDPKKRLRCHISETRKGESFCHRTNWIRSLLCIGVFPQLEILDEVPRDLEQSAEMGYIHLYKSQGCDLVNGTPGGDGSVHSFEALEKMRVAATGRLHTLETRQKLSLINTGKKQSVETVEKRVRKLKGQKRSPQACKNISLSLLGRTCSPEAVENMSKVRLGKKLSPEHRQKLSLAGMGRKISEETRGKLRAAASLREAKKKGQV